MTSTASRKRRNSKIYSVPPVGFKPGKVSPEARKVLQDDPETAYLAELLPEDPELLSGNMRTWDIWQIIKRQVRVGYKGAYALDLGAVVLVLGHAYGIDDIEWELVKMEKLFYQTYTKE